MSVLAGADLLFHSVAVATLLDKPEAVNDDIHIVVDNRICMLDAIPCQARSTLRMLASTLAKVAFIMATLASILAKVDAQRALHSSRCIII